MLEAFDSGASQRGKRSTLPRILLRLLFLFLFSPPPYYIHTRRRRVAVSCAPRLTPPSTSFSFQLLSVTRTWLAPHDNGLCFLKCFNTGYYRFATGSPTTTSTEFLLPSSFHPPDKVSIEADKNLSLFLSLSGRNFTHA